MTMISLFLLSWLTYMLVLSRSHILTSIMWLEGMMISTITAMMAPLSGYFSTANIIIVMVLVVIEAALGLATLVCLSRKSSTDMCLL